MSEFDWSKYKITMGIKDFQHTKDFEEALRKRLDFIHAFGSKKPKVTTGVCCPKETNELQKLNWNTTDSAIFVLSQGFKAYVDSGNGRITHSKAPYKSKFDENDIDWQPSCIVFTPPTPAEIIDHPKAFIVMVHTVIELEYLDPEYVWCVFTEFHETYKRSLVFF